MDPVVIAAWSAIGGAGIGTMASLGGQLISNRAQRSGRRRQEQLSAVRRLLRAAHRLMDAWTDYEDVWRVPGNPDADEDALAAAMSELQLVTNEVLLLAPQLKVDAEALRRSLMPDDTLDGPRIVRYRAASDALIEKARKTLRASWPGFGFQTRHTERGPVRPSPRRRRLGGRGASRAVTVLKVSATGDLRVHPWCTGGSSPPRATPGVSNSGRNPHRRNGGRVRCNVSSREPDRPHAPASPRIGS